MLIVFAKMPIRPFSTHQYKLYFLNRIDSRGTQRSILGSILFNIYINDLFFLLNDIDIYNFADDTKPYIGDF